VEQHVRCPVGEARLTSGHQLDADYVIHAVAPVFEPTRAQESIQLLASTYQNALELAASVKAKTCAIPALGCGVNSWEHAVAAEIALEACAVHQESLGAVPCIEFFMREPGLAARWLEAAQARGWLQEEHHNLTLERIVLRGDGVS